MGKLLYTKETFHDNLQQLMPESDFEVLEFNGIKQSCSFICHKCNNILNYTAADKIKDRGRRGLKNVCKICEDTAQFKPREKIRNKIKHILQEKPHLSYLEYPQQMRKKIKWHCNNCNHDFEKTPTDFINFPNCPWCEGVFSKLTINIIKQRSLDLWGNEYEVLDNNYEHRKSEKITVKHNKCGFYWATNVNAFLQGHGCPRCKCSSGERKVRQYLEKNGFYFEEQKRFEGLKLMSFDFYLEENNQKIVIEYQGRQHYEPVGYFGGQEAFLSQQKRDNEKREYCKKNNIILIEIPYYDESLIKTQELAQRLRGEGT